MNWNAIAAIATTAGVFVTATGLFFIGAQIIVSRRIATANLAIQLDSEFRDHLYYTYEKFLPDSAWSPIKNGPSTREERSELQRYLVFFDTLQVLRDQNMINLETIDKMFAYRFFIAINNPHTIKCIGEETAFWDNLIVLFNDWVEYRRNKGKLIPNEMYRLPHR